MEDPLTVLQTLGGQAADGLEAFAFERAVALEQARENVLRDPLTERSSRAGLAAFGFAAALVVVTLLVSLRAEPTMSFRVDARIGRANDQIAALRIPVQLSFSDGTRVTLGSSTLAHVVSLRQKGAQIALENGSLEADVVHTGVSAWSLSAGPFSVRATGTKFALSWDPDHERFSIRVTQGGVTVAGSIIGAERAVRAGETLVATIEAPVPERSSQRGRCLHAREGCVRTRRE
jgi:ferric-dicitrate binding protein FerR (iron transport regulator)